MVLVTALLWGILPIFIKMGLNEFSAGTIVWFRFAFAFVVLFALLSILGHRPGEILSRPPILGILGGACLSGNYFAVTQGVHFSSPANMAILIQIAPVLLVIVGVYGFREKLQRRQVLGMAVAVVGFYLFYVDQRDNSGDPELYSFANGYIFFAAIVWVGYMVCQKSLSVSYGAQQLNLLVYATATVVLLPLVRWGDFIGGSAEGWAIMIFLSINTLLAYGALAESVKHIPLWLISIIIVLNPIITLLGMLVLPGFSSGWLEPETIATVGYTGALIAVSGVVLVVSGPLAAGQGPATHRGGK